jgi:hypothetical protein
MLEKVSTLGREGDPKERKSLNDRKNDPRERTMAKEREEKEKASKERKIDG